MSEEVKLFLPQKRGDEKYAIRNARILLFACIGVLTFWDLFFIGDWIYFLTGTILFSSITAISAIALLNHQDNHEADELP